MTNPSPAEVESAVTRLRGLLDEEGVMMLWEHDAEPLGLLLDAREALTDYAHSLLRGADEPAVTPHPASERLDAALLAWATTLPSP